MQDRSMDEKTVLEARDVTKTVASPEGPLTILADVSLRVRAGETLAIVGASGAGKSTLLSLLAGLDSPSSGRVSIAGVGSDRASEDGRAAVRGKYVGFVFQSFHLIPSLTALENVMLPLELANSADARATAAAALGDVGLSARLSHYPKQLSGGEQQRVAIARAFVTRPHVLFADEPTGNLDTATGQRVTDLLFELNRSTGSTLVLVTHDRGLARALRPDDWNWTRAAPSLDHDAGTPIRLSQPLARLEIRGLAGVAVGLDGRRRVADGGRLLHEPDLARRRAAGDHGACRGSAARVRRPAVRVGFRRGPRRRPRSTEVLPSRPRCSRAGRASWRR